jgi:hypothetical protein
MPGESNILVSPERIRAIESALRQRGKYEPPLDGRGLFNLSGLKQEVEGFTTWIDNFPAEPRAAESGLIVSELMNGVYQWLETGDLPTGLLDVCEKAARHRLQDVRLVGVHNLQVFSRRYPDAHEELKRLVNAPKWQVRFELACAVAYDTPPTGPAPQQLELLECLLRDESAKVRAMAVDKCRACRAVSLVPQLAMMQQTETNDQVRRELESNIPLIRAGQQRFVELGS